MGFQVYHIWEFTVVVTQTFWLLVFGIIRKLKSIDKKKKKGILSTVYNTGFTNIL